MFVVSRFVLLSLCPVPVLLYLWWVIFLAATDLVCELSFQESPLGWPAFLLPAWVIRCLLSMLPVFVAHCPLVVFGRFPSSRGWSCDGQISLYSGMVDLFRTL